MTRPDTPAHSPAAHDPAGVTPEPSQTGLHIAFIGTRGVPARYGGFETAAQEIGARLALAGHRITVYCRNPGQTQTEFAGMSLVNLPALRRRSLETFSHTGLSVGHILTRSRPDVVVMFNAANAPFLPALRAAQIPVAVHVDGLEWQRGKWGPRASSYYKWAQGRSAAWGDVVIADARGIADMLAADFGISARYIAYGAPIVALPPDRLADLGVKPGGYHLVVARFEPENHVAEIVAGYAASSCELPLLVVGDAPYADAYRCAVQKAAGTDPRVRLLGSIYDDELLDTLYCHAASYLHGHSVGGTNPSLLRAMGAGAPVTAYDVVFNREVAGESGVFFASPDDVAQLCEAVEANPASARARGNIGRADAEIRYRWDHVAAEYEDMVRELVQSGQTPRGGTGRNRNRTMARRDRVLAP